MAIALAERMNRRTCWTSCRSWMVSPSSNSHALQKFVGQTRSRTLTYAQIRRAGHRDPRSAAARALRSKSRRLRPSKTMCSSSSARTMFSLIRSTTPNKWSGPPCLSISDKSIFYIQNMIYLKFAADMDALFMPPPLCATPGRILFNSPVMLFPESKGGTSGSCAPCGRTPFSGCARESGNGVPRQVL